LEVRPERLKVEENPLVGKKGEKETKQKFIPPSKNGNPKVNKGEKPNF